MRSEDVMDKEQQELELQYLIHPEHNIMQFVKRSEDPDEDRKIRKFRCKFYYLLCCSNLWIFVGIVIIPLTVREDVEKVIAQIDQGQGYYNASCHEWRTKVIVRDQNGQNVTQSCVTAQIQLLEEYRFAADSHVWSIEPYEKIVQNIHSEQSTSVFVADTVLQYRQNQTSQKIYTNKSQNVRQTCDFIQELRQKNVSRTWKTCYAKEFSEVCYCDVKYAPEGITENFSYKDCQVLYPLEYECIRRTAEASQTVKEQSQLLVIFLFILVIVGVLAAFLSVIHFCKMLSFCSNEDLVVDHDCWSCLMYSQCLGVYLGGAAIITISSISLGQYWALVLKS